MMSTLRARCMELIRDNPAFTREDVKAIIQAWDAERGKQKEVTGQRVAELVYLAQVRMGLPRRLPWPKSKVAMPKPPRPPRPVKPPKVKQPRPKPDPARAEQHLGLVHMVIRRYQRHLRGRIELDDLVQEGLLGVIRAQKTWDPAKGSFATHAFYGFGSASCATLKAQRDACASLRT